MLKFFRISILVFSLSVVFTISQGQSYLNDLVKPTEIRANAKTFFENLSKERGIKIYYLDAWLDNIYVDTTLVNKPLRDVLDELFARTDLNYIDLNANTLIIIKDPRYEFTRQKVISNTSRQDKKIEFFTIGNNEALNSNKKMAVLSGTIQNDKTKEPIVGANIIIINADSSNVSDLNGRFKINFFPGNYLIKFQHLSHDDKIIEVKLNSTGEIEVLLEETPTLLSEVVIEDKTLREITTSGIGQSQLSMREIKRAPALLGEIDLIKQIQVLPGVTTAGEAASGFNVRGGSVDQNLILYDGLPVFNSSHVFGFFSAFNSEAVRDVTFYRGGIPASFGGRVSSVLDIRAKEGSVEKWQGSGGIGMVSTNVMIQGPIKRNKTSVVASIRTTYSDWLINTIKSDYVGLENSTVTFYDGTVKLAHSFSEKTKLTLSSYLSNDQFRLQGDSTYKWNTYLTSMRLDNEFNEKLNGSLTIGIGSYSYDVFDKDKATGFSLGYGIVYPSAKADFFLNLGKHKFNFGAQGLYYDFNPGTLTPSSNQSNKKFVQMEKQASLESGIYVADQFDLASKLHADLGFRYSMFSEFGPRTVNIYEPEKPIEVMNQIDTIYFTKRQTIKSYQNFEPRVGLRYEASPNASIKFGYNRIYQYLHLVSNTTAVTPIDIWQPSGYYFKPQQVDQFSLGYFRNFKDKKYEAFIEGYYKLLDQVLEFKDGAQLILNPNLETDLLQGTARTYGIETQVVKNTGRLNGSLSYAFSRSLRTIQGDFPEETINEGREYASNFDQPHVINLNWRYNITKRYFFTGSFTYRSGRPITLPLTAFSYENFTVSSFSDRNQYRVPDYHRLDVGFVIEGNHKRRKLWDGTWTVSIYNVYARKNAYSIFFQEVRPGILRPYQLSIIGVALPSISYSFKF